MFFYLVSLLFNALCLKFFLGGLWNIHQPLLSLPHLFQDVLQLKNFLGLGINESQGEPNPTNSVGVLVITSHCQSKERCLSFFCGTVLVSWLMCLIFASLLNLKYHLVSFQRDFSLIGKNKTFIVWLWLWYQQASIVWKWVYVR